MSSCTLKPTLIINRCALIAALKCNIHRPAKTSVVAFRPFRNLWKADHQTDQPTNQQIDTEPNGEPAPVPTTSVNSKVSKIQDTLPTVSDSCTPRPTSFTSPFTPTTSTCWTGWSPGQINHQGIPGGMPLIWPPWPETPHITPQQKKVTILTFKSDVAKQIDDADFDDDE